MSYLLLTSKYSLLNCFYHKNNVNMSQTLHFNSQIKHFEIRVKG
jgi:hypothetical protein